MQGAPADLCLVPGRSVTMDQLYVSRRSGFASLFNEDFDRPPAPPPPPEPEVIEPVFTLAELGSAREMAWREGHDAAVAEAERSATTTAREVLARIAAQLDTAQEEADRLAEQSAEALAHLLFDCFATAFPALCRQFGEGEVRAITRSILPALRQEPKITVRVHPVSHETIFRDIERIDPDLTSRVELIPTDAMATGDIRISWRNGGAVRDTAALWQQIADVLIPGGVLPPRSALKEIERVE